MYAERCYEKGDAKIRHRVIAGNVCDHARKCSAGPIGGLSYPARLGMVQGGPGMVLSFLTGFGGPVI